MTFNRQAMQPQVSTQQPGAQPSKELIAYLNWHQAQWLDDQLTKARIQFTPVQVENGWKFVTTVEAKPYVEQIFPPKPLAKQGLGGGVLRLALLAAVVGGVGYVLLRAGIVDMLRNLWGVTQFTGMGGGMMKAGAVIVGGMLLWFGFLFVSGRKASMPGTLLFMFVLAGAAFLVWRM